VAHEPEQVERDLRSDPRQQDEHDDQQDDTTLTVEKQANGEGR
jgi:hypothetical protein